MRIFENANYDFIGFRKKAYILSGIFIVISLISFAVRGIEMGIDFQGGMEFVVEANEDLPVAPVRSVLADALGDEPEVKTFGSNALLIRTSDDGDINAVQSQILETLAAEYPNANPTLQKTDIVGPRFAEDLKRGALYSVLGSLLVIFVYVLIRFEWRFGATAVLALFHDVIVTLGVFSLLQGVLPFSLQIDQTLIAAFLTIVGYSINDTVVIFDRIREYTNLYKTMPYATLVNRAINSTLSRTIITSLSTLFVILVLFIFGGEVLRGFAFAVGFGIIAGSYSTIFVAAPLMLELRQRSAKAAV